MKKLCKLFWKNDILGKWILYDSETKKVLEVKKFTQEGEETHVNLLESEMLKEGVLELEHCIKVWEVELILAEVPVLPAPLPIITPLVPDEQPNPSPWINPLDYITTSDRTWPNPQPGSREIRYGDVSTHTYTTTFGESVGRLNGSCISNSEAQGFSNNLSYFNAVTSNAMSENAIATYDARHNKFLVAINHLAVDKNYKMVEEAFAE